MTNAGRIDPYKEEDEGFLAARNGKGLSENPYPRGTIRFKEWQRGWRIGQQASGSEPAVDEHHVSSQLQLADNPHPRGTIRHRQWSLEWHASRRERERMERLAGRSGETDEGWSRPSSVAG